MTCRYFSNSELVTLFERMTLSKDIQNGHVIGVSEVVSLSFLVENDKKNGVEESKIQRKYENIIQGIEEGKIWILELTSENLSRLLLEEDFYMDFCDKKGNPFHLSKRVALFYDSSYSYWTENVYLEAFDND